MPPDETVIAVGGDLAPESLKLAYSQGIFPWPDPSFADLIWACPPERGIIEFESIHVPRSLERAGRKAGYTFTILSDPKREVTRSYDLLHPAAGPGGSDIARRRSSTSTRPARSAGRTSRRRSPCAPLPSSCSPPSTRP